MARKRGRSEEAEGGLKGRSGNGQMEATRVAGSQRGRRSGRAGPAVAARRRNGHTETGGRDGRGNRSRIGDASRSRGWEVRETIHGRPGAEGGGGNTGEGRGMGGGTGQDGIQRAGETKEVGGGEAGGGGEGCQRRITVADAARLQRDRNPLDATADAIRMEIRDRGHNRLRMEHVVERVAGLGLSAMAVQEGIENLVSLELVSWTPGEPFIWRESGDARRNRSRSPARIAGGRARGERGGASGGPRLGPATGGAASAWGDQRRPQVPEHRGQRSQHGGVAEGGRMGAKTDEGGTGAQLAEASGMD